MAIKHKEVHGSREGTDANDRSSQTELAYVLYGSDVIDDMRDYIAANTLAPDTLDGLVYSGLAREQIDRRIWRWAARYVEADRAEQQKLDIGETVFSFDTTGGTHRLYTALERTSYKAAANSNTPTDHKKSINVRDGKAEGVDIIIPALKFTLKKRIPRDDITEEYVKLLARMTGTTNDDTYRDYERGELLFAGATGQQGTKSDPEVLFNFIASENLEDQSFGDIPGVDKKGHEYLWPEFEKTDDTAANRPAVRTEFIHVDRVYREFDFMLLGI
jgi:hypothetical protein